MPDLPGLEPVYVNGKTRYFPTYQEGVEVVPGSAWRYRPRGVIDEALWLSHGYIGFDITPEVNGGQGADRYL